MAFTFLKSIVSCMAAPTEGTSDYENALVERAIYEVWKEKKNRATITDLALWLQLPKSENRICNNCPKQADLTSKTP